jgi:hypothetical protein
MRNASLTVATLLASVVAVPTTAMLAEAPAVVAAPNTSAYVAAGPHRLADTRSSDCGCQLLDDGTIRIQVAGRFDLPVEASAAAITVTATRVTADGVVSAYPAESPQPGTSLLNPRRMRDVANSSIIALGEDGAIDVHSTLAIGVGVDLVVDVTGVFVPAERSRGGRFVEMEPVRVADTRTPDAPASGTAPGTRLRISLPAGIAPDARALVVNVTTIGGSRPGFFSMWPADRSSTATSFMNVSGSARPLAASLVAPVSPDGLFIETTGGGHIIVDVSGWFTGESSVESSDGLFVARMPVRMVDTRWDGPRLWPAGTRELAVDLPAVAIATNVTIDRSDGSGFVSAHAAGTPRPPTSTVNPYGRDDTIANFAITSVSDRGVAYFSDRGTDLIVDRTGYFTGSAVSASLPPAPNVQPAPGRAFLVGDSTLAAVRWYGTREALLGYPYVLSAESCRRLATASCRGREGYTPSNTVTAIERASGRFDVVVVMAGYDDWWTVFPNGFDEVVAAARGKGARTIVWLTYREDVGYVAPGGLNGHVAFVRHNRTLREKVASGRYDDVVIADWDGYTQTVPAWFERDGIHLTFAGSYGVADYISRMLAHLERRPCPRPWIVGGPIDSPCGNPDHHAPVADVRSLYR